MFTEREAQRRVANEYTAHDLVVVLTCSVLEGRFGLRREAVSALVPGIAEAVARPTSVGGSSRLVLCVDPPSVRRVDGASFVEEGLVLALDPVFDQVDNYLLPGGSARVAAQKSFAFGQVTLVAKPVGQRSEPKVKGRRRS